MKIHYSTRGDVELPGTFKVTVKQVLHVGIKYAKYPKDAEVSISFVPECEMRKLMKRFKGVDEPTDVLSFPALYELTGVLGDIVICPEFAKKQAIELGHTFEREIAFLTAHGLLHLLGYSHSTEEEERIMIDAQKAILAQVGVPR